MKINLFLFFTIFAVVASANPKTNEKLVNRQVPPPASEVIACTSLTETPDASGNVYLTCSGSQTTDATNTTSVAFVLGKAALCGGVVAGIKAICA